MGGNGGRMDRLNKGGRTFASRKSTQLKTNRNHGVAIEVVELYRSVDIVPVNQTEMRRSSSGIYNHLAVIVENQYQLFPCLLVALRHPPFFRKRN